MDTEAEERNSISAESNLHWFQPPYSSEYDEVTRYGKDDNVQAWVMVNGKIRKSGEVSILIGATTLATGALLVSTLSLMM